MNVSLDLVIFITNLFRWSSRTATFKYVILFFIKKNHSGPRIKTQVLYRLLLVRIYSQVRVIFNMPHLTCTFFKGCQSVYISVYHISVYSDLFHLLLPQIRSLKCSCLLGSGQVFAVDTKTFLFLLRGECFIVPSRGMLSRDLVYFTEM